MLPRPRLASPGAERAAGDAGSPGEHDELRTLGSRVEAFKKVAPTHPHPHVPNEALPRMAAGPAASLFDRMRDLATGRGTDD